MRGKSIILVSLAGATLLSISAIVTAQETLTPVISIQSTSAFSFGMIGLGTGETARLNAVNLVRTPPAITIAQVPCKVEFDIYDGQGKLIMQKTVANLDYGQADFLDLARSDIANTSAHFDVSGTVRVGSSQSFFCNVSATLEVFDNVTGATTAILANPSLSPPLIFATPPRTWQP